MNNIKNIEEIRKQESCQGCKHQADFGNVDYFVWRCNKLLCTIEYDVVSQKYLPSRSGCPGWEKKHD